LERPEFATALIIAAVLLKVQYNPSVMSIPKVPFIRGLGLLLFMVALSWAILHSSARTAASCAGLVSDRATTAHRELPDSSKNPLPTDPQEFYLRCHSAGVLVCVGFDSPTDFVPAKWPGSGLYPAGDQVIRGSFDTTVKASGKGSLRFEIPSHSGANAAGSWIQRFGRNFGEGTTFYVQFRERFSPEMLKNHWGDTSWKQVIFHNAAATCASVELTTGQYYHDGFPIMYTECGGRGLYTNSGTPPYLLEQGDYNCWYGQYNAKSCFMYPANAWVTFYYQVSLGHWGKPDSSINAWVALDGQGYRQWIRMPHFILRNEHPGQDYDSLTLLTYMTNKDASKDLPTAYAWYDELIVSTEPIAPPTASDDVGDAK
jgi:hypothetical protein